MIIVRLQGGLGNQMFQHALGRRLALKHNTSLYYDDLLMQTKIDAPSHTHRDFELNIFKNLEKPASQDLVEKIRNAPPSVFDRLYYKIRRRYLPYYRRSWIYEKEWFGFDENILNTPNNCYLDGYWQHTKYFDAIDAQLRSDFIFPDLDPDNLAKAEEIKNSNSVSLHIRLGDYVRNQWAEQIHGNICGIEYYKKAIEILSSKIENPIFYLFSDEPEVASEILGSQFNYKIINANTGKDSWKDMHLMSLCKHNIIANSSFSWWAGWLNRNPGKIVIRPKKWVNEEKNTSGLTLPNGIEI